MKKQKILITGAAGFIGYWLCKKLLDNKNNEVVGLDNLNSYYSVKLKKERLTWPFQTQLDLVDTMLVSYSKRLIKVIV